MNMNSKSTAAPLAHVSGGDRRQLGSLFGLLGTQSPPGNDSWVDNYRASLIVERAFFGSDKMVLCRRTHNVSGVEMIFSNEDLGDVKITVALHAAAYSH